MHHGEPVLRAHEGSVSSQDRLTRPRPLPLRAAESQPAPVWMVTDIVNFTGLVERLGDLHALHVTRAHNQVLRAALALHGGRVVSHTGDGLVSAFDSALSGVRCAEAIQSGLSILRAAQPLTPVHVRIGLHAGHVLTDGDTLFGAALIAAVRVCSQAGADQVLLSEAVHALLTHSKRQHARALGATPLKGFAQPMPLYAWHGHDVGSTRQRAASGCVQRRPAKRPKARALEQSWA